MKKYTAKLNSNDIVFAQNLVKLTTKEKSEILVKKGKYIVDGKSILGLLSLGGLKDAVIECENPTNEFLEDFSELNK